MIFKTEGHFPRGFGRLPVLHSVLTECSVMTPLACRLLWRTRTQSEVMFFKPQLGISWATAAASCLQAAGTQGVCECGRLEGGLKTFENIKRGFQIARTVNREWMLSPEGCSFLSSVCCWTLMPVVYATAQNKQNFVFRFCFVLFSAERQICNFQRN